jgi:hypothetical protein
MRTTCYSNLLTHHTFIRMMNPRRRLRFRKCILPAFFLVLILSAGLANAQEGSRIDVFGGYSFMRFDSKPLGFAGASYLSGWNAEASGNINLKWAVTLDASGHYGNELTIYHFLIGPQYSFRRDRSRFFVHGLFGKAHDHVDITSLSLTDFTSVGRAFGGGGGFDYDWSPRLSIRVFQADYLRTDTFKTAQNNYRVSAGVVFHFGHIGHRRKL